MCFVLINRILFNLLCVWIITQSYIAGLWEPMLWQCQLGLCKKYGSLQPSNAEPCFSLCTTVPASRQETNQWRVMFFNGETCFSFCTTVPASRQETNQWRDVLFNGETCFSLCTTVPASRQETNQVTAALNVSHVSIHTSCYDVG